jgi:hypothetical protein
MLAPNFYRVIPTDGRRHISQSATFWLGNSRGRWEGDTLVVEVTGLNGKQWFDSAGNYYTENTRVVERWRLVDANTIDYEATIEDPTIYSRPWKMTFSQRRAGSDGASPIGAADNDPYANERWEAACHEGNREHIAGLAKLGFRWFRGVSPPK